MSKRSKACEIPPKVREAVERRDGGCCIFCGKPGRSEAHIVSRAHGGLGIEENILTVCRYCHDQLDNGKDIRRYKAEAIVYIHEMYPDWSIEKVTYHKDV